MPGVCPERQGSRDLRSSPQTAQSERGSRAAPIPAGIIPADRSGQSESGIRAGEGERQGHG